MENQNWELQNISIKKEIWGENKGKYTGEIRFSNGQDTFTFALNPTLATLYLNLIKDTVIASANQLGDKLSQSLNEINETDEANI